MNAKSYLIIISALLLASVAAAESHISAGDVSGAWKKSDSPYIIEGNVAVPVGQKLTIEPGAIVTFAGNYSFAVHGTLEAGERRPMQFRRKEDDKRTILFTADLTINPSGWGGLRFIGADDESYLFGCIIENARVQGPGGGIYCEATDLDVANCEIRNCEAATDGGAIAVVEKSKVNLSNLSLKDNAAGHLGGGLFANNSEVNLANMEIESNRGGGLAVKDGQLNLANCSISDNTGAERGGGIFADGAEVNLANVSVSGNSKGGIVCLNDGSLSVANTSVRRNKDAAQGGGIYLDASSLSMTNASVNDNDTGGIYARNKCEISLVNCAVQNLDTDEGTTLSKTNTTIHGD